MKKTKGQNLVPNSERTPNELRKMTKKGGIASGASRRRKKEMREIFSAVLDEKHTDKNGEEYTLREKMAIAITQQALEGNTKAFEQVMRYSGDKPKQSACFSTKQVTAMVEEKVKELTEKMKEVGLYTSDKDEQIRATAQICVKTNLAFEASCKNGMLVSVTSREGNVSDQISQSELLYIRYYEKMQTGLRALGLNTDSKPVKLGQDKFDDFYDSFQIDDKGE